MEQKESLRFRVVFAVLATLFALWQLYTALFWQSKAAYRTVEIVFAAMLIALALALWIRVWRPRS